MLRTQLPYWPTHHKKWRPSRGELLRDPPEGTLFVVENGLVAGAALALKDRSMFLTLDLQYTLAELERAGIDVTRRAVLYALFGVSIFHRVFAPLDSEGRLRMLTGGLMTK